jgi:hypothetical protein
MPAAKAPLLVEDELKDQSWYLIDGVTIAQFHAESEKFAIPGVGERYPNPTKTFTRLGPVATYKPPVPEPVNFGAVVQDRQGCRLVAIAPITAKIDDRWYESGKGTFRWDDLMHPMAVLAQGVAE